MAEGSGPDIIQRVLELVLEVDPLFGEQRAEMIEQRARREWAGVCVTIARRGSEWGRLRAKVLAEIGIKSPRQLREETGLSRSTIYRWVKK